MGFYGSLILLKILKQMSVFSKRIYPKPFMLKKLLCKNKNKLVAFLIYKIIRLLEDGQWHLYRDITREFNLSEAEFQKIMDFLEKFEIVEKNEKKDKARLRSSFLVLPV